MASPGNTTVTIDGNQFNAISTHVGFSTIHDEMGMPLMGSQSCSISVTVDIHDNVNMPFSTLSALFGLSNQLTRDKVRDMKIEYWTDESRQDAICVYQFSGWISSFYTISGAGSNHLLSLTLQPALTNKQYVDVKMSN
ncbi:hypothetical protein [Silvibacterium dinghuense]|uniref:Uncharacterized protein n=1 Tax=Silvibacterium dinghuense TaxID=1560006 RepID=A0A4Q1S9T8_9BACT|nr:hypothetical protein [Silvibacterium dinghuense]RXS93699.1 hypothetical protein ESZ00_16730 [Silvibacterium dinghuense]GGH06938.1 hypothetical protein GCM10011586_23920 [Silvibacterium dinghuense]